MFGVRNNKRIGNSRLSDLKKVWHGFRIYSLRERQKCIPLGTGMWRLLAIAVTCALAANGFFANLAETVGLGGFGDHLAALVIAVLVTPLAVSKME